jgi:hypothetical protein
MHYTENSRLGAEVGSAGAAGVICGTPRRYQTLAPTRKIAAGVETQQPPLLPNLAPNKKY